MNKNVWLIALCNAVGFCAIPLMMFVGSIVGAQLAPSLDLATLPIAFMVIGTAVGAVPVPLLMKRLGRRPTYILFALLGAAACFISSIALVQKSFILYCTGSALLGVTNAAIQQLRFTAMESVSSEKGPAAASLVLCGGIFAAFLGPELAVFGKLLTTVEYQGSFWLVAMCYLFAASILAVIRFGTNDHNHSGADVIPRSMFDILGNPQFCLAVASATIAFMIMTFVMTATPISMHHHHGHSLEDTKWVIQSHIAAMFLPSLIGPLLLKVISIRGLMLCGLAAYLLTIVIGMIDLSVSGYWFQLVFLGVGWNFLFIAGTSLLPTTYRLGEQYKARAFNDGFVFSAQALASLSAGWVISSTHWQNLLLMCFAPIVVLLIVLLWSRRQVTSVCTTG